METEFQVVVELCEKLEATSKRTLMVSLVADFLRRLEADEVEPAVSMLLGRAFPKWDQRTLEVSWRTLSGVIKRITDVKWSKFSEAFGKTGDVGAATKIVFESGKIRKQAALFEEPLTILEVRRSLEAIAEATGHGSRERKERLLETLLGRATSLDAKYIVKIMIGEMRTGFHEGLMELAVSKAFNVSHETVQRASMLTGDTGEVAGIAKIEGGEGLSRLQFQLFRPIKPMLAQTADDVNEVLEEHGGETAFEQKLDGARIQIHKCGNDVRIYSRRLTDVTESFPEIVRLSRDEVGARKVIVEGEVIALGEDGRPLPFQHLMRRFRRARNIEEMVKLIPVELYLFDLPYLDGQSLTTHSYAERRETLEEIAGSISLTKQLVTSDAQEAERFLDDAIAEGHEGLMAKKLDSPYTPGIRGKRWFKIKKTLEPLDLVIVAAEWGYGRRHNWLSDYHLAAKNAETGELLMVGKTFKGLTDEEFIEMTKRLKELSITEEHGKVVVAPKIVIEVAYNEIQKSPKYKCGMALRFARITRIRDDLGSEDADTIQRVREIYEKQFEKKARYSNF
ncbi:MAG: ATP-dependent DNA ligase [Candidatus Bathyarchaeota archaeon]|nr:ATP-dependent DNA ligase [Candidatus Bathyarchaeota archaeon]